MHLVVLEIASVVDSAVAVKQDAFTLFDPVFVLAHVDIAVDVLDLYERVLEDVVLELAVHDLAVGKRHDAVATEFVVDEVAFEHQGFHGLRLRIKASTFEDKLMRAILTEEQDAVAIHYIVLPTAIEEVSSLLALESSFALFFAFLKVTGEFNMFSVHLLHSFLNILFDLQFEVLEGLGVVVFDVQDIVLFELWNELHQALHIVFKVHRLIKVLWLLV